MDGLCPPYLEPGGFRVYVIDNREWNAFAMGNYSIYVFTGLLHDLDDDEVAIVLGHEMVHATHEHTRRQFKKQMWIQLAALGLAGVEEATIDDKRARAVAQLMTVFAAAAVGNGYGRDLEDQADRVGLRYAYEGGYDITKGPRLWNRFAKKYGEGGKVANFFFGDHSLSSARAANLEKQIAFNYPDGPKVMAARARPKASPTGASVAATAPPRLPAPAPDPGSSRALAPTSTAAAPKEIKPGMTTAEVQRLLGPPKEQLAFGTQTKWVYPSLSVVFEGGKVKEVRLLGQGRVDGRGEGVDEEADLRFLDDEGRRHLQALPHEVAGQDAPAAGFRDHRVGESGLLGPGRRREARCPPGGRWSAPRPLRGASRALRTSRASTASRPRTRATRPSFSRMSRLARPTAQAVGCPE